MSATTAVGGRGKQKAGKGQKGRQRRRQGTRTVPTNNQNDSVTTSKRQPNGGSSKMYHKQNAVYDGTGRLYECMSVAELNIRLRNLADHCLATHKGNLEQREKLIHEIKDIQKTVDQLLGELKDQVMAQIQNNAKKFGNAEERLVQLQKEKEQLEMELAHEKNKNKTGTSMNENLKKAIDDQVKAVQRAGDLRAQRLQNDLNRAKAENDDLKKRLKKASGQLRDRDEEASQMKGQLRDLESARKDLENEIGSLRDQLKAKDKQRLSATFDPALQAQIDDLKKRNKDLAQQLARAKNEAKTKEATIADLIGTHKAFEDKLGDQLKKNFDAFLDKASEVQAARRDTETLKEYYKEQLDRMHALWEQASKEIRQVFDKNYRDLKDRLETAYSEARARCDELEELNKRLEARVTDLHKEKISQTAQLQKADAAAAKQQKTLSELRAKLGAANSQLLDLQVKISQYRVIWNHYMMLEGKLKNEIGHLTDAVTTFEDEMQVEPPMAKRRKIQIGSIREYSNGLHLPLELSEVPTPDDLFFKHHFSLRKQNKGSSESSEVNRNDIDNERFLLVNNSRSSHFTLLGQWYLENDRGERVPLQKNLELAPGGALGICMGSSKLLPQDLLLSQYHRKKDPFITFAKSTDRLYLIDTIDGSMELFSPSLPKDDNEDVKENEPEYDSENDTVGGPIEHARRLKHYLDIQELVRIADKPYFILVNVAPNPVILKGFKLKRERGNFEMKFPEIEMAYGHPVRFLFAAVKEYDSDILIHPRDFGHVNERDNLLLEDKFGDRHHLLSNMPSPQRVESQRHVEEDKCLVM